MASIQDLYNAILSATASLNKFTTSFPRSGGNVTPINNLSSAGFVQVIVANSNRNNITFHNPGSATVYVAPTTVGSSGGTLNPSISALGGTFEVLPGGWVTLAGVVQQGFQAMVSSGSSQPLTIMDQ
jgi:hypothetical protein